MTAEATETASETRIALPSDIAPADLVAYLAAEIPERSGVDYVGYEHAGESALAIGVQTVRRAKEVRGLFP